MSDIMVLYQFHTWFLDLLTGKTYSSTSTPILYRSKKQGFKRIHTVPNDLREFKYQGGYELDLVKWRWVDSDRYEDERYPSVYIAEKYRKQAYANWMLRQLEN